MAEAKTRAAPASKHILFLRWVTRLQEHRGDHTGVILELLGVLRRVPQIQRPLVQQELDFAALRFNLITNAERDSQLWGLLRNGGEA